MCFRKKKSKRVKIQWDEYLRQKTIKIIKDSPTNQNAQPQTAD